MIPKKQQARNDYNALILYESIPNVLGLIDEIPYSKKLKIIEKLVKRYNRKKIIIALNEYRERYINLNRINIFTIENILISMCEELRKEEEKIFYG